MEVVLFYWIMILIVFMVIMQYTNYCNSKSVAKTGDIDYDTDLSWLVAIGLGCVWPITLVVSLLVVLLWLLGRRW